jgi:hypothetical protein
MGLSREDVEKRLKANQLDCSPLDWGIDGEIKGREETLDFDPVVLGCTEIYLANQSFYQHALSKEWMKNSAEPNRSLLPKTDCVGSPSEDIWEKSLESYLKVNRKFERLK